MLQNWSGLIFFVKNVNLWFLDIYIKMQQIIGFYVKKAAACDSPISSSGYALEAIYQNRI